MPVHPIMFTQDRDALPPSAAEKFAPAQKGIRVGFGSSTTRALISDVYGLEVLSTFGILHPSLIRSTQPVIAL
jgi:hypothetical protein